MDLFGVSVCGTRAALGGGTVRDILLDIPVYWTLPSGIFPNPGETVRICLQERLNVLCLMIFPEFHQSSKNHSFMKVDTIKGSSYVMTCTKACTVSAIRCV